MSEWWTYSLHDLLMFSPRTYYRMFELHNAALWPAHIATIALGLSIPVLLRSGWSFRNRAVGVILAACWSWVGWSFLLGRYASINWAATWLAALFTLQAALMLVVSVAGKPSGFGSRWGRVETAIFVATLLAQPIVGLLAGRPWRQAEVFGIVPDPTAIATLGLLLPASSRFRWWLLPVPVLWCAISGATLWAMGAPDAWLPPAVAALAVSSRAWFRA